MKILNPISFKKWKMPKGKLSCKWVKTRNKYQCYAGGKYIYAASGDTKEEALTEFRRHYEE